MPVVSVHGVGGAQEEDEFRVLSSLVHIASMGYMRPCLKKNTKQAARRESLHIPRRNQSLSVAASLYHNL